MVPPEGWTMFQSGLRGPPVLADERRNEGLNQASSFSSCETALSAVGKSNVHHRSAQLSFVDVVEAPLGVDRRP